MENFEENRSHDEMLRMRCMELAVTMAIEGAKLNQKMENGAYQNAKSFYEFITKREW